RGDWTGAGLSAASMIPVWGDAIGKGGKLGRYAAKYGDEATEAAKRGLKGAAELRPYGGPGGGHHVPARKGFEGAPGYDVNKALAIPNDELKKLGIRHGDITQSQRKLYQDLSKTGRELTWDVVQDIETKALVAAGMPHEMAEATVKQAIEALRQAGISKPTHIPWGGANQ
ncbi:MAG: hypothetical protein WHT09_15990, partial [Thermogutta sp.]